MISNLTHNQKEQIAGKIMDWGNLVFIGLTISQFFPGPFEPQAIVFIIFGYMSLIAAYLFALWLMKGGGKT